MRILFTLLFIGLLFTCVRAQVGNRIDAEYVSWCMVDSVAPGQLVRFKRMMNVATLDVIDIDPIQGNVYSSSGTLFTCEDFDLRTSLRNPLDDFYDECGCEYTISQENHRVSELRGGAIQEFDVEFQQVIRRRCADETSLRVIERDTLTRTGSWAGKEVQQNVTFTAAGQYIDNFNLRGYLAPSGAQVTIALDLNPNTVQASYPSLTLDPLNFTWDGGNGAEMEAAYTQVLNFAVSQALGAEPVNTYRAFASGSTIGFRLEMMHEPLFPFLAFPPPGATDYEVTSTIPSNPVGFGFASTSLTTTTELYSQLCDTIFTRRFSSYILYDRNQPTEVQPRLNVNPSITGDNNPTTSCSVPVEVCEELSPDPVTLAECVEICSDVLNLPGHFPAANVDTTLTAATYNSISIYVTSGPVGVVLNGDRINYPTGWSTVWSAAEGELLQNAIRIDATDAEAIISYVR